MPLYDYHCQACGQDFELLVRASSTPACPHCASTALDKQVSRVAPAGTSAGIIAAGRRAAAREGHFSNYSKAERSKLPK
ncbi:putative regulatory protein, FmdB family [Burkholderiales bacterium JOSHI_001]|nr:putative regulatory protein, FmdB family [Burkholderiales bacterium JOSHI_001]